MSTGFAIPASGALTYQEAEEKERQRWAKEEQKQRWIELGAQTLGFAQSPIREGGEIVGYAWQQRHQEQALGLPQALISQAKLSLQAEADALHALLAKRAEAHAYADKNRLSDQARATYIELACAEAATAHRDARTRTPRALHDLGQLAERATAIRAIRNAAPARKQAVEQQAKQALDKIDAELQAADLEAMQLGISG